MAKNDTMEVTLKMARGSIKTATVDIMQADNDFMGYDFKAWINFNNQNVEMIKGSIEDRDIQSYYPFEDHDEYKFAGTIYAREKIETYEDWVNFVREYVANLDPRDVFKYRRLENL